ncbi:hypothetical protein Pmani_026172 [Petrolisthes manimaculis]|uniref:Decapping nuclease n=1 Tax=Petrolisthes manimaculis TaxID=1843537 RepID=A0AAE1TY33_9EUCA|nr:hypothetical protein Pmani_026172 [Petrolisthes manimaculis]
MSNKDKRRIRHTNDNNDNNDDNDDDGRRVREKRQDGLKRSRRESPSTNQTTKWMKTRESPREDRPPQAEFQVHPRWKYEHPTSTFRKPMVIGDFSLDQTRKICHDRRNLHYITVDWKHSKKVKYDLNVSYDKTIKKNIQDTKQEKLDRLLDWILNNTSKFHTEQSKGQPLQCLSTDFVCFRGLLTELLCTPYENREGWIICATRFRDTVYLCAYETPEKQAQRQTETDMQKKMCSWGYKFEQYMIDGSDITEGVNENEEYCCVVRSRLESHSLVYGAEVDGADPSLYKTPHRDLSAFIELKTSKEVTSERDQNNMNRYKLKKWWSQSYLVGIPNVICGLRDVEGTVHTLQMYKVQDMPQLGKSHWRPHIMMNFVNKFLEFVKKNVQVDDPESVYKFEKQANGGNITCTYLGKDSEWAFLPKWYYEKIMKN